MKVVKSFLQNFTMVFYPEDSVIMTQRAVGCCRLAELISWSGHCGGELAVVCGAACEDFDLSSPLQCWD